MSLFGAGWTLGSLKYVAEGGVQSATYYETIGWRGVMESEQGSREPAIFRSLPGSVFPLYHVLADFGEFAGGEVVPSRSSDPLTLDGVVLRKNGRSRSIVANLTADPQTVTLAALANRAAVKRLNESTAVQAMLAPAAFRAQAGEMLEPTAGKLELRLLPFETCRVDWHSRGR
jgi:hypothetical protein